MMASSSSELAKDAENWFHDLGAVSSRDQAEQLLKKAGLGEGKCCQTSVRLFFRCKYIDCSFSATQSVWQNWQLFVDAGLFIVRQSASVSGDYVLSVVVEGEVIHYQIRKRGGDALFSLADETKVNLRLGMPSTKYETHVGRTCRTFPCAVCFMFHHEHIHIHKFYVIGHPWTGRVDSIFPDQSKHWSQTLLE